MQERIKVKATQQQHKIEILFVQIALLCFCALTKAESFHGKMAIYACIFAVQQ